MSRRAWIAMGLFKLAVAITVFVIHGVAGSIPPVAGAAMIMLSFSAAIDLTNRGRTP